MLKWLPAAALLLLASPALAQQVPSGPVDQILRSLEQNAKEKPSGMGRDERGFLAVLTMAPDGSYSVLAIRQDGIACVLSTGAGWQAIEAKPSGKGA